MAPVGWKGVKGRPRGRRVRAGAPPPVFSLIGSEITSEALRHRKEITNEKDADCPHCHSSAGVALLASWTANAFPISNPSLSQNSLLEPAKGDRVQKIVVPMGIA
jgi:hypothetical protein